MGNIPKALMEQTKSFLSTTRIFMNEVISFIIFSVLDILDFILCYTFKVLDFMVEAEWKPCYCSSTKEAITRSGKILVSEQGENKRIVSLRSSKVQLVEISDTLYTRPSIVSEVSKYTIKKLKKLKMETTLRKSCKNVTKKGKVGSSTTTFTVNSTNVKMLQGKVGKVQSNCIPRWSDCDCDTCHSWSSCSDALFVEVDGTKDNTQEDVIFIHGFISSLKFWTETVFPNFSKSAKSKYRFIAFDLLGFGRSPKPMDSLYTLAEHLNMIQRSVFEKHKVRSFHIVAHSMGCILALALAVKYKGSVKSLTFVAPPYFPTPESENAEQYMMRRVAPRRIWPALSFGASIICWYEHICRLICLLICKNHGTWEFIAKLVTRNRIRTYLMEGFWCHTHKAAWHTLHNIICGTASKIEGYLDVVKNNMKCDVTIFHGRHDEIIPVECSYNVQARVPRANVKVIENRDHITIVVGRQKAFAMELEEIWRNSSDQQLIVPSNS